MPKLTKRTAEQLRAHLGSLSADDLVDLLLAQAGRDNDLRDRLLIDAMKRGADAVDLKSFQRSLDATMFDLAEGRHGAEYTSTASASSYCPRVDQWRDSSPRASAGWGS